MNINNNFVREKIVGECNAVRQALQDLLSEFMNSNGAKSDSLDGAIETMCQKTKGLHYSLIKDIQIIK